MLILSITCIYVISISQSINVPISQYKHKGIIPKHTQNQKQQAFLSSLNIFKSFNRTKDNKVVQIEYDQSEITKTINLPRNIWPSIPEVNEAGIERQERIQKYWEGNYVYHKICQDRVSNLVRSGNDYSRVASTVKIILDGPPYANGRAHFGHFLNKTIKDVFLRFFLLQGDIPMMIPAWDCHGMPIENKVLKMYNREDKLHEYNKEIMDKYNVNIEESESEDEEEEEREDGIVKTILSTNSILTPEGEKNLRLQLKMEKKLEKEERKQNYTEEELKMRDWSIFVREKCKECAYRSIKTQMNYFKKSGIWAFWEDYYATYHTFYEKAVMDTFVKLKEKGYIYQAQLPQTYSSKSKTVLADSEILHRKEKVLTTYISFKVDLESCSYGILKDLRVKMEELNLKDLKLVVYTTTGYTIPGNKGLAVNRRGKYHLYQKGNCVYIMNDFILNSRNDAFWSTFKHIDSLDMLTRNTDVDGTSSSLGNVVGGELDGSDVTSNDTSNTNNIPSGTVSSEVGRYFIDGYTLEGIEYFDPVYGHRYKVYIDNFVETNKGTGIVHLSPAHGYEDFNCISQNKELMISEKNDEYSFRNLFDENEVYYPDIHPHLKGLNIRDFNEITLCELIEDNLVKYEYKEIEVDIDWRCENKVHTRLTNQYCLKLPKKYEIMEMLKKINITPTSGEKYLKGIIDARNRDWCLSRQRFWGTPIPYEEEECLVDPGMLSSYQSDKLWYKSRKMLNVVDVWFESALIREMALDVTNVVMTRMLKRDNENPKKLLAKYLEKAKKYVIEGQDQHRGWFQSMIIVNMLLNDEVVPFDNLFAHLFVTVNGQKLSKSKTVADKSRPEEGTKQLVMVNKDLDLINRVQGEVLKPIPEIEEDINKVRETLTPGHELWNLLNPGELHLDEVNEFIEGIEPNEHNSPNDGYNDGVQLTTSDDQQDIHNSGDHGEEDKAQTRKSSQFISSKAYHNVDVLRTLACNNDFLTRDLDLTQDSLKASSQTHKKIVNCFKYMTSVLAPKEREPIKYIKYPAKQPWEAAHERRPDEGIEMVLEDEIIIPEKSDLEYEVYQLNGLDTYFLNLAYSLAGHCKEAYENAQFFKVLGLVEKFITNLSNLYFSYIKNFVYILPRGDPRNRAIRFVLNKVLYILLKVVSPIMPHMSEDLYMKLNPESLSVFTQTWPMRPESLVSTTSEVGVALAIRKIINKENSNFNDRILKLEENKLTASLLKLEKLGVDLRLIFNVAEVDICKILFDPVQAGCIKYKFVESGYKKCKRCWLHRKDVEEGDLCGSCRDIMVSGTKDSGIR